MPTTTAALRLLAAVLVVVLTVVLSAPAKAEAVDPMTAVAIAGAAVCVVIIIAFLVVANMSDKKEASEGTVVWIASASPGPVTQSP